MKVMRCICRGRPSFPGQQTPQEKTRSEMVNDILVWMDEQNPVSAETQAMIDALMEKAGKNWARAKMTTESEEM